jgi:hypothetical protein
MSGLTCQQIVFACAERKSQRGLRLGVNAFAAYDLDRPIDHLICDGINADGGYVLASRVSVDFSESDLLQSLSISASCSYGFFVFTSSPLTS